MKFPTDLLSNLSLPIPSSIQRRLVNYALRKTLGPLLRTDLSSDDLDLQFKSGRLSFNNLDLRTETINEKLSGLAATITRGFIGSLEISIPWADLWSGRVGILIRDLTIHVSSGVKIPEVNDLLAMSQTISHEVANVAQSFLEEEEDFDNIGIGSNFQQSALFTRVLDSMIANISLDIINLTVVIETEQHPMALSLNISSLTAEAKTPSQSWCEARGLEITLIRSSLRSEAALATDPGNGYTSSRSTSVSSSDDQGLMQSMIFGKDEGRSLYMSAMSSPSMYYSTFDEANIADYDAGPHLIVRCEQGLTILITSDDTNLTCDIICQDILMAAGDIQLRCAVEIARIFTDSSTIVASDVVNVTPTRSFDVNFRLSSLNIVLNPLTSMDILSHNIDPKSSHVLELILQQLLYQKHSSSNVFLIKSGQVTLAGTPILGVLASSSTNLFTYRTHESAPSTIHLDSLEINMTSYLLTVAETVISNLVPLLLPGPNVQAKHADAVVRMTLQCPAVTIRLIIGTEKLKLVSVGVVVTIASDAYKHRLGLEFHSLICSINAIKVFQILADNTHIIDFTWLTKEQSQRKLDFIKYSELFSNPERDSKSERSTIDAVKQKAKSISKFIVRSSIGKVTVALDSDIAGRSRSIMKELQLLIGQSVPSTNARPALSAPSDRQTCSFFLECACLEVDFVVASSKFSLIAKRLSAFIVRNIKQVDVGSLDCAQIKFVVRNDIDQDTSVLSEGLHSSSLVEPKNDPMLTLRCRRNLLGTQQGSFMARLGLVNVNIDYYPEMPWVEELIALSSVSPKSSLSVETSSTPPSGFDFAVDLTAVSVGLNPYAGACKGLLYFRNSTFQGYHISNKGLAPLNIHAGVLELFLIDNIEGCQNDTSDSKRTRTDYVASPLIKLGFVQVASIETVDIKLSFENETVDRSVSVRVSGAILTMTTCADSTQTLLTLINMLRIPVIISDDLKYNLGSTDDNTNINVFQSIDEDAFSQMKRSPANAENIADAKRLPTDHEARFSLPSITDQVANSEFGEAIVILDDQEASSGLRIVDEHFLSGSLLKHDQTSKRLAVQLRVRLENCFLVWNIHDGYDWAKTRTDFSTAVEVAMARKKGTTAHGELEDESITSSSTDSNEVNDLLFNSIYISLPTGAKPEEITEAINKELAQADMSDTASHTTARPLVQRGPENAEKSLKIGRSKAHKARIEIGGISVDFDLLGAEAGEILNQTVIAIRDFEVIDNVPTSTWRKFITQSRQDRNTNAACACRLEISTIRPVLGLAAAELAVKAEVAPVRLHVDQDTLEFLTRFFEFKNDDCTLPLVPTDEIFVQKFEVYPIKVQIDYKPKRVDFKSLRSGRTTEFKNFFILEDSNMTLKHVLLYGISGFPRVFQLLNDIWLAHVKSNQLASVLAGVAPLRSLASFGGGLKDLVMLPISEYQKNGTVIPGLQKGVSAFAKTTGQEAIRLGAKLAVGTQRLLETAESTLSNTDPRENSTSLPENHAVSAYANQPANLRQGVSQAISGMTKNVVTARDVLAALPGDWEGQEDTSGAVRVTAKSVPKALIRPLIGTTEMVSKTLLGLRNTMNPEQRRLNDDKYK